MIDERTRAALARLTENERACLVRRLQHQTAKEMAIDLGISPHAVEKRLKMARTKLGVSSSLEAAQLLVASERYGQSGPQASDLGAAGQEHQDGADPMPRKPWRRIAPYVLTGVIAMSFAVIALLAVAPLNMPPGGVAPTSEGGTVLLSDKPDASSAPDAQSSYLVQLLLKQGDRPIGSPKLPVVAGKLAHAASTNADGTHYDITLSVIKSAASTYFVKMDLTSNSTNGRDIHVKPSVLVKAGEPTRLDVGPSDEPLSLVLVVTPTDSGTTSIGETSAWRREYDQGHGRLVLIKATSEQIKAFVADAFDEFDKDRSGFVESSEVPPDGLAMGLEKISASNSQEDIAAGKVTPLEGKASQRAWIGLWDKNRDGKLSRGEFADGFSPDLLRAGGVPEGWPGVPPTRDGDGRKMVFEDVDRANFVQAPPATIRAFVNSSFDSMDKDHSGFIERREAPAWPVGDIRFTGPADLPSWHDDTVGRAVWIARADTDGDGRISRAEFMAVTYPMFASRGVPANWPGAPKVAAK